MIHRDSRYPIRCTVQFYMIQDVGRAPQSYYPTIQKKHDVVYELASKENRGSLVVPTQRVTETAPAKGPVTIPVKWRQFVNRSEKVFQTVVDVTMTIVCVRFHLRRR